MPKHLACVVFDAEEFPERMPRPTKYIPQMIDFIQRLIEKNHAYVAEDGVVYFDTNLFPTTVDCLATPSTPSVLVRSGLTAKLNK